MCVIRSSMAWALSFSRIRKNSMVNIISRPRFTHLILLMRG
jgi:hypothetical protein